MSMCNSCNGKENATLMTAEYGNTTCQADINLLMYNGTVQITDSGKTCLDWVLVNIPEYQYMVDGSAANAKNYCRNINYPFPWCITQDTYDQEICIAQICKDSDEGDDRTGVTMTTNTNRGVSVGSSTLSSWTHTSITSLSMSSSWAVPSTVGETSDLPSTLGESTNSALNFPEKLSSTATPVITVLDKEWIGQNSSQVPTTGIQTPAWANASDGMSASTGLTPPTETSGCKKRSSFLWLIPQTVLIAVLEF